MGICFCDPPILFSNLIGKTEFVNDIIYDERETNMTENIGLKPEHHGNLNTPGSIYPGGKESRYEEIEQLRAEYADDPVALQQIDVYDGRTKYHDKIAELRDALKAGDTQKEAELEVWFNNNYPDIG